MFYTRKGDDGTTKTFDYFGSSSQRISKNSAIAEALGSLDEINSFLGLCKVQSGYLGFKLGDSSLAEIVHEMQKNLFIVQAELASLPSSTAQANKGQAGASKTIEERKVKELEKVVDQIEKALPPIKTFFISGGSADITKWQMSGAGLGSIFDIARTIARRAERRVVALNEELSQPKLPVNGEETVKNSKEIGKHTLAYLNRLSSALYALARFSNHKVGIVEESPDYR